MACVSSLESLHHAFIFVHSAKAFWALTSYCAHHIFGSPGALGAVMCIFLLLRLYFLWHPALYFGDSLVAEMVPILPQQSHLTADCLPNLHSYVKISLTLAFSAQPRSQVDEVFSPLCLSYLLLSTFLFFSSLPPFFLSIAHLYFKHHYTFFHLHIFPTQMKYLKVKITLHSPWYLYV